MRERLKIYVYLLVRSRIRIVYIILLYNILYKVSYRVLLSCISVKIDMRVSYVFLYIYSVFFNYFFLFFFVYTGIYKFIVHIASYECEKEYINIFEKVESLKTLYTHAHKSKIFFFFNFLLFSFAALK